MLNTHLTTMFCSSRDLLAFLVVIGAISHSVIAAIEGDVRFAGTGATDSKGRVEYYTNNAWHTICTAQIGNTRELICKQMKFTPFTNKQLAIGQKAAAGVPQIQISCGASDLNIKQCPSKNPPPKDVCPENHQNDLFLECLGTKPAGATTTRKPDLATLPPITCNNVADVLRLEGGTSTEGRVMVKYQSQWGGICDDGWGYDDAKVVCRMLCNTNAQATALTGQYTSGVTKLWLSNLKCQGTEATIDKCPHDGWGNNNCDVTKEAAAVRCTPPPTIPPDYPQPNITCTSSNLIATFSIKHHPNVTPKHIRLLKPVANCGYKSEWKVENETIDATVPLTACGTEMVTNDTHIIYKATLVQEVPDVGQTINRVQEYQIPVSCAAPRLATIPPKPIEPVIVVVPPKQGGLNLKFEMHFSKDGKPITDGKVSLGVDYNTQLDLDSSDPNIKMVVLNCYAQAGQTTTKHQLIVNKCPVDSSIIFQPINETSFSFQIESFQFKNYPNAQIYTHCEVNVCKVGDKSSKCDQTCKTRRRRRDVTSSHSDLKGDVVVMSEGLIAEKPSGDGWFIAEEDTIIRYVKLDPLNPPTTTQSPEEDTHLPITSASTPAAESNQMNTNIGQALGNNKDNSMEVVNSQKGKGIVQDSAATVPIVSVTSLWVSIVAMVMTCIIR